MTTEELTLDLFQTKELLYTKSELKEKYLQLYRKFLNTQAGSNDEEVTHNKVLKFRLLLNNLNVSDYEITELNNNILFERFCTDTFNNKRFKAVDED